MMIRVALLVAACAFSLQVSAQPRYPSQPVRLIVPFAPGGTTDIVARLFAQRMTESTGQQFIVDNRGGAGGSIGANAVAKAAPDGYTLLVHNIAFVTASASLALANRLPYDIERDFTPVSMLVSVPPVIVVHPSVPAASLKELAGWLRANPDKAYGTSGPGSMVHLWTELFKSVEGVRVEHIPFKGAAPAMQELLVGRVHVMLDQLSTALPHIRSGKLRPIAVTTPQRVAAIGDVPTTREQGYPQLETTNWNSLFGPAGLPPEIASRLHAEALKAVSHPDVARRLHDLAAEGTATAPAEFDRLFRAQIAQWAPVVKRLGVIVD
jgi:tripartite-type tricarboxylate transporter receptor subunit TctC